MDAPLSAATSTGARPARWRGAWGWVVLALLLLLQYVWFRAYVLREIAWAYPASYDQGLYLSTAYETYESLKTAGSVHALWASPSQPSPQGALMPAEAAVLFLLLGPGRLTALTVGFLHYAVFQCALAGTLRWLTRRWGVALLGVGLLLTAVSPFAAAGGVADFRLDFAAAGVFGLLLCLVIRSRFFASRRWSLAVGAAAAYLILFRHLTAAYVAALAVVFLPYLLLRTWRLRGDARTCRLEVRRLTGFALAGLVLLLVAAPVLWGRREVLWQYYVVCHVTGSEAAVRAKEGWSRPFYYLYYAHSLLREHTGARFERLAAAALLAAAGLAGLRPDPAARRPGVLFWVALAALAPTLALLVTTRLGDGFYPLLVGAVALTVAAAAALTRWALARRPGGSRRFGLGAGLPFLAAALIVPLGVLTLDPARSFVVADVALPALLWAVLAALIGPLGLHRDDGGGRPALEHALAALAGVALFAGVVTVRRHYHEHGPLTRRRADAEQVLALHDLIDREAIRRGWQSPKVLCTSGTRDYFHANAYEPMAYERHGILIRWRGYSGITALSEPAALALADSSDILLLLRPKYCALPYDESMQAALPKLETLAERRFVPLGTFRIDEEAVTVYARRGP